MRDYALQEYAPFRSTTQLYTRQNAGAELNWRPNRQWNVGAAYGYERYDGMAADTNATNENSGKVFADWKPTSWMTARASYLYSARRYENYDNFTNVGSVYWPQGIAPVGTPNNVFQNPAYRQLMFADRDRNQAKLLVDVDLCTEAHRHAERRAAIRQLSEQCKSGFADDKLRRPREYKLRWCGHL